MDLKPTSRRNFLSLALGAPPPPPSRPAEAPPRLRRRRRWRGAPSGGGGGGGAATYWYLSGPPGEAIREDTVKRFNTANPDTQIKSTDVPERRVQDEDQDGDRRRPGPDHHLGLGRRRPPEYVKNDQVVDLTSFFSENAAVKDRLFPASFGAATVDGKVYALPTETVQPIVLYWNKKVFDKVGAQPPQSWADIMALVEKFNSAGVAPFSLGGQSRWTNMMWLEFLLDRQAGPEVFQNVFEGKPDAWSDPAVTDMLTKVQDLVKANGFIKGFASITADSNADQALLYTGKAAMMLHGSWTYGSMKASGGDFVTGGHLGFMNFPPLEGGKGDPTQHRRKPGPVLLDLLQGGRRRRRRRRRSSSPRPFRTTPRPRNGSTPATCRSSRAPTPSSPASKDAEFLKFIYDISGNAKTFAQSWDQALPTSAAETLLDNIAKLFQLSITPQQWIDNMNKVIVT